jgi:hypothetical protein
MAKITLEQLIDIAAAVEEGDPIDWDRLEKGQQETFKLIGTSVLEMFDKDYNNDDDRLVVLATITKLIVENMILHLKLMEKNNAV